ncbi:MAG: hypothetical protein WBE05_29485 [Pseudolabrys sp.]|jgi:hypothetical protein
MLKSFSICAALILAAAAFSTSAEAQHRGFGGGARMGGGAHFSGARMGGFSGARMGGFHGARMGGCGAALALLVLREWESPVQAGSLVQAGLLGQAEVIGPAAGGLAIGTGDIGGADAGGPGA